PGELWATISRILFSASAICPRTNWRSSMAILRRNCPHCPAEHVAFDVKWAERASGHPYTWNGSATCGACNMPISFMAKPKNIAQQQQTSPTSINGDIEQIFQVLATWPTQDASTAPAHTPTSVAKRFLEGEDAFRRGNWNSAVAMYRSALDIATKGMDGVPAGKT